MRDWWAWGFSGGHCGAAHDDVRRRRVRIEVVHERRAVGEDGLLVERPLVGDLAARRARVAWSGGSGGPRLRRCRVCSRAKSSSRAWRSWPAPRDATRPARRWRRPAGPGPGRAQASRAGKTSAGDERPVGRRNHHVLRQAAEVLQELDAQRTHADPRPGGQLEVLVDAAVEHQAQAGVAVVHPAHRVAQLVEPFLVERRRGQLGLAEESRRDVRARAAALRACSRPGTASPPRPAPAGRSCRTPRRRNRWRWHRASSRWRPAPSSS